MATDQIKGRYSDGNAPSEAFRVLRSQKSGYYSGLETTIATGQTNVAFTSLVGASDFFSGLPNGMANYFEIYSDVDITIRFRTFQNSDILTADLKPIKIIGNSYRTISFLADVSEFYITNKSGSTANVEAVAI